MDKDVNIARLRSELDELHKSRHDIERLIERKKLLMLKALPSVHDFDSMDALICTLAQFASTELRERIGATQAGASHRGGKGIRYPAELRVAVRKGLEAGESASSLARAKGISLATIIRWRKLWGLESKRGRPSRSARGEADAAPSAEPTPVATAPVNGRSEDWAL
jgi:DNA invertase Pin-like site-specific DNA recombinase